MEKLMVGVVRCLLLCAVLLVLPAGASAQFFVDNPPNGGTVSGISLVSGWKCVAAGQITVQFDNNPALTFVVAYGTSREDTRAVCADANNGFGLLINWNNLGTGKHTASLRDNGVEFANVTFTVQTFGQEFLRGVSGALTLTDFPTPGGSTRIQWQENQQNFVITDPTGESSGSGSSSPRTNLENPQPGSFQSGIGLISGWACEASQVEVEIDGSTRVQVAYGTSREDTRSVCGDADNGFGLLVNWNLLGNGTHTVRVLQDGTETAHATFAVATLGLGEFPQGLGGTFTFPNFPHAGEAVSIQWQESQQNFVIAGQNTTFTVQNSLTVQRVFAQDALGTEKSAFAPGEPIQFAAELNNSYGGYLLGANQTQLAITTSFYDDTKPVDIPPGISMWTWNATAPSTAGNYTVTVRAFDPFYGVWVEGSANFTVGAVQGQLPPEIVRVDEPFREGQLVFFKVYFTDPNNDAEGFGFRGANGAPWAEETHPFSSPSYGRVYPGIIEYPFNLGCGTGSEFESDVEVWIYDSTGLRSQSVTVHLACTITPVGGLSIPSTGQISDLFLDYSNYESFWYKKYYDKDNILHDSISGTGTHSGIDISNNVKDCDKAVSPVYAAAPGTVIWAGWAPSFGWSVVVKHGYGLMSNGHYTYTLYGHMGTVGKDSQTSKSCLEVQVGNSVNENTIVGYQGSSGLSLPAKKVPPTHVHFMIFAGDKNVTALSTPYDLVNKYDTYPASPDFYTCMQLTLGDPLPEKSVTQGQNKCSIAR